MRDSRLRFVLTGPFLTRRARLRAWWNFVLLRHAEEICMACGGKVGRFHANLSWWRADDALWNAVTGDPRSVRCPGCFTREAHALGMPIRWEAISDATTASEPTERSS